MSQSQMMQETTWIHYPVVRLADVVAIMAEEVLFTNLEELGAALGSPWPDIIVLRFRYNRGDEGIYNALFNVLYDWCDRNIKEKRTVGILCKKLRRIRLVTVAERLENQFSVTAIVDPYFYKQEDRLQKFLGSGAFGIVVSAKMADRMVAVKFLPPDSDYLLGTILPEYRIMSRQNHPNLVNILGQRNANGGDAYNQLQALLKETDKTTYLRGLLEHIKVSKTIHCIEMELCGQTLRFYLTECLRKLCRGVEWGTEHFDTAKEIANDVIAGLKVLHSQNILHRDLKPDNIYFSVHREDHAMANFPVKIGDFGQCLDVVTTETTTMTDRVYSRIYRAPEAKYPDRESGALRYGENADWFSVGLIIYELFYLIPRHLLEGAFDDLVDRRTFVSPPFHDAGYAKKLSSLKKVIVGLTYTIRRLNRGSQWLIVLKVPVVSTIIWATELRFRQNCGE